MKVYGKIGVIIVLSFVSLVFSADITFSTSGTIQGGEIYNYVRLENEGTVVDMSGGQVTQLYTYDASVFNMSGGEISGSFSTIVIGELSTINISVGSVVDIGTSALSGNVSISGGSIIVGNLKTYGNSIMEVTGGVSNFDTLDLHGTLNLRGGEFDVSHVFTNDATVNIYGYGFNYDSSGGTIINGILTGYLLDGNQFTLDNLTEYDFSRLNLIPEPITLMLLGLGGLFLRKRS